MYYLATTGPRTSRIRSTSNRLTSNSSFHSHLPMCTSRPSLVRNLKPQFRWGHVKLQICRASSLVVSVMVSCWVTWGALVFPLLSSMSASVFEPLEMELTRTSRFMMFSLVPNHGSRLHHSHIICISEGGMNKGISQSLGS